MPKATNAQAAGAAGGTVTVTVSKPVMSQYLRVLRDIGAGAQDIKNAQVAGDRIAKK